MLEILLTGFGPFQSVVSNPSERLVRHFSKHAIAGAELATRVFPVSFLAATAEMEEAISRGGRGSSPFDLILMLGVAGERVQWSPESVGRNRSATAVADQDGYRWPESSIVPDASTHLLATLPADLMANAIERAGLPAGVSDNAGDYLCNHLFFWTLHHLRMQDHQARAGFLHIPPDDLTFAPSATPRRSYTFEQHCSAIQAVLDALTASVGEAIDL